MTDFEEFEGGVAVAKAPEEAEAQAAEAAAAQAAAGEPVVEVKAEPVDSGIEMEWEVETVPPEEPEVETVTEETVVEEYYEPGYRRSYGPDYGQNYNRGYGQNYGRGYGQGYNTGRRVARRYNKHLFTWVLSFFLGIYGADRFARGQIGLGLLKLMTFGGLGFWYLYDVIIAMLQSYAGPYRNSEEVSFDQYGMYIY